MTEQPKLPDPAAEGDEDPRKQLWIRAGVAGGLIAVLLGALAIFDHLSKPPPPPEEVVVPTKPIAPAQVTPEPGRDAPPDVVKAGSGTDSEVPPLPAPEATAPPQMPADEKAGKAERLEPARRIAEGTRPLQHPAAPSVSAAPHRPAPAGEAPARPAPARPEVAAAAPAAPAATPSASAPAAAPVPTPVPTPVQPAPESRARPAAPPPAAAAAPAPAPAAAARAPAVPAEAQTAYMLQLGVFTTPAQADALRARLMAEGVPAQLETRVVVGPFNDRRDALALQARLREKGFSAGELIPFRR